MDVLVLAFLLAVVAAGVWFAQRSRAPLVRVVDMDLSPAALPKYALLSFLRGAVAYLFSLAFTLVYGTVAAKSRAAERVMIPLLDVLQGIPVLGFMPGLVLGMIALFPDSNVGLELACIIMIFTGQVWNMTFSFHGSLRAIPTELVEVSTVYGSSAWRKFTRLELPASAIGLIWNSMMSMAGGWFFLMINEAFQLNKKDYRLPGIGSYMSVAYERGDGQAICLAILAMTFVIVATDQLIWRPLVAWSEKFRVEELGSGKKPTSWVLDLLRRSKALGRLRAMGRPRPDGPGAAAEPAREAGRTRRPATGGRALAVLGWLISSAIVLGSGYGALRLLGLLGTLPASQWGTITAGLGLTVLRTIAALLVGALWTVPVGVAIGLDPRMARLTLPVVQVLASFPAPMVFPLFTGVLVDRLGLSFSWSCTLLTLFGAQWYVLFNVIAGASSIPGDLREVATVFGTRGLGRWRRLYLPAIFPHLLVGLITSAGGAWNAAIVTEYQQTGSRVITAFGLGSLISQATDAGDYALLAGSVLALTVTIVLLNRFVWKRLYRWSDERFSLNR
ncbi:MAG TPA: ABC transporter permease subunit [Planctomycetota bacterium]|nr:ABC transporter permease subunit [Planctomycetota bacterium]